MQLIRDILDKQVVDREQIKIGKVDGIVAELREGAPPKIVFVELGAMALAHRLGPTMHQWAARLAQKVGGADRGQPHRIAWHKVRDIGVDIEFDLDVRETTIFGWQDWLRRHVICRIPGA